MFTGGVWTIAPLPEMGNIKRTTLNNQLVVEEELMDTRGGVGVGGVAVDYGGVAGGVVKIKTPGKKAMDQYKVKVGQVKEEMNMQD